MSRPLTILRNLDLLAQSFFLHLQDDPALLAVQISRRLPLVLRSRTGRMLMEVGRFLPRGVPVGALGAVMAGRTLDALTLLRDERNRTSRLGGELLVLLDRGDLVSEEASIATRARLAWARGDLSGAVEMLDDAGKGQTRLATRYRSELNLLSPGVRLCGPRVVLQSVSCGTGRRWPLQILHLITNSLPHTQSGYSLRTHCVLTGLKSRGIEPIALTRTGYPVMVGKVFARDIDVVDGVRYGRVLPSSLGTTPAARLEQEVDEALSLAQSACPQVIHATTDYRNALVARSVSEATGLPWIYEVRGLMEQTWIASHSTPVAREAAASSEMVQLLSAREGELAQSASAVVTLSRTMAEELVERGVDPEKITLVPNGVDPTLLEEQLSPEAARRAVGFDLPLGAFAVGALSALVDYEGFDVLLEAAALLLRGAGGSRELAERMHVVLVGDGVAAPQLAELAQNLGISDRVHLLGRVPPGQARYCVQALDVVTVPRLDRDVTRSVTPQKPVEALALGRPVVVSDLPALRETVTAEDGSVRGVLVEPESPEDLARAILELARDPERRAQLAQNGRSLAAERTWPKMMRRYEDVYRSVLDSSKLESWQ